MARLQNGSQEDAVEEGEDYDGEEVREYDVEQRKDCIIEEVMEHDVEVKLNNE